MNRRRKAGEGQIRQRPNGKWEARLRFTDPLTGLSRRESLYGDTEGDVRRALQEMQRRIDSGEAARDDAAPLGDYLNFWLENAVKNRRKPSTVRSYTQAVDRLNQMPLARKRLRDLKDLLIQASIPEAPRRTDVLSFIVLRAALEQAVKWRLITRNPAEGVVVPRPAKREMRIMSRKETQAFLEHARADRNFAMYQLALDSGMREGELFALRKLNVDLDRHVVKVRLTYEQSTKTTHAPKTKAAIRDIHISKATVAALRAHIKKNESAGYKGPLIFPSEVGTELHASNFYRRSFMPIREAIGVEELRFHDLRHTAATLWLEAGMNPKAVSERLGHASVRITMDLYGHAIPSMHADIANVMDDLLSSAQKRGGIAGGKRTKARNNKSPKSQ